MEEFVEIRKISDEELIVFCNEIFEYQNGNGDLNKDAEFYKFFKEHQSKHRWDIRFFETLIIDEARNRFDKVVKLLMINAPRFFIKCK